MFALLCEALSLLLGVSISTFKITIATKVGQGLSLNMIYII